MHHRTTKASALRAGPGRIRGILPNGRTIAAVRKHKERIIGAVLQRALSGDAEAARLCFEWLGITPDELAKDEEQKAAA